MHEIKLARRWGQKSALAIIFGMLLLLGLSSIPRDLLGLAVICMCVIGYGWLCFQLFANRFIKFTPEGIWYLNVLSRRFISWTDFQQLDTRLGIRILHAPQGIIQLDLSDFKDPHQLTAMLEAHLPAHVERT